MLSLGAQFYKSGRQKCWRDVEGVRRVCVIRKINKAYSTQFGLGRLFKQGMSVVCSLQSKKVCVLSHELYYMLVLHLSDL